MAETRERWRTQLPHWEVHGRPHFVTIRCAGSLPPEICRRLDEIRCALKAIAPRSPEFAQLQRRYFLACEKYLDAGSAFVPFRDPRVAARFVGMLRGLEGICRWRVSHFVVMPNHVHLLLEPGELDPLSLRQALSRLKGRAAREGNRLLQRTGAFWQAEWFDHWVRDDAEENRIIDYIRRNPVRGGLAKSWELYPWVC